MDMFSSIGTFHGHQIAHADGGASAPRGTWLGGVSDVFNSIGNVLTGWGAARGNPQNPNQPGTVMIPGAPQQGNNTALIVGIIFTVLVIGGVLLWVAKRKK